MLCCVVVVVVVVVQAMCSAHVSVDMSAQDAPNYGASSSRWWWWWWKEGREEGGEIRVETNRTIWAKVPFKIARTEQPKIHPVADSLRSVLQDCWN